MRIDSENNTQIYNHFHQVPTENMVNFTNEIVLVDSKYIFYQKAIGRTQKGFCTHCKSDFYTEGLRHNDPCECPKCKSVCIAKSDGRGRSKLKDKAYFVYFDKSLIDPKTVTAIGYYVERDYTGDYREVETLYKQMALYLFAPGKPEMYWRNFWDGDEWKKRRTISGLHKTSMKYVECFTSVDSIKKAIKGTQFETKNWKDVELYYIFEAFDMYARNYAFELLMKFGMTNIIYDKLRYNYAKSINWRGKTLDKVLGVGKQDWKEIRKCMPFSELHLQVLKHFREKGFKCTVQQAKKICGDYGLNAYFDDLVYLGRFTTITRILNYTKKQSEKMFKKGKAPNSWYSLGSTLRTFRDYIKESIEFKIDLSDSSNLFPKDLYAAHQRNIERKKAIADAKLNAQFRIRYKQLETMHFEFKGLFIRPVKSAQELTYEGNRLQHCVASYGNNYANGNTDLFVLRRKNKPNKPFFTVEIQKNEIRQVRGIKNSPPTSEVQAFIEIFETNILADQQEIAAAG